MIKVLFVNDEYIRKNFPIPERMDSEQIEGFIKASQLTHLTSLTGYCFYEYIEDKVVAESLTAEEVEIYQIMQYLTGMHTYQMCNEFLKTEVSNTKAEESWASIRSIDDKISAMKSQINSIEARFRRVLESSSVLDEATGEDCGYEIDNNYNDFVIHFPHLHVDTPDCDGGVNVNI